MLHSIKKFEHLSRPTAVILALLTDGIVGYVDYVTGYDVSVAAFYLIGVAIGVWFIGIGFGVFMCFLSVITDIVSDVIYGVQFPHPFVHVWNAVVLLIFYLVFARVLASLHSLNRNLENQVRQRTNALTEEMGERERLERELLEISDREQRRIGQDLHDSLCQHLTGATLAAQVLQEKLSAAGSPVTQDASRVVGLVEQGIDLSRRLARGLSPVEMTADGLMLALEDYAATTSELFKVHCRFECDSPVLIHDATIAGHLYRIAQEAVGNALKHGRAADILIRLDATESGTFLSIKDNGSGLPDVLPQTGGLGLRIMAHRSAMIGARFKAARDDAGGTLVTCELPTDPIPLKTHPWINQK